MSTKNTVDRDKLIKLNADRVKSLLSFNLFKILKKLLFTYSIIMFFVSLINVFYFAMCIVDLLLQPDALLLYMFQLIIAPISSLIFGIHAYDNIKELYEISSDARDNIYPVKALNDLKKTLIMFFALNCADILQVLLLPLGIGRISLYNHWFTSNWLTSNLQGFLSAGFETTDNIAAELLPCMIIFIIFLGIWCYFVNNMAQTLILNFCTERVFGISEADKLILSSIVLLVSDLLLSVINMKVGAISFISVILMIFFYIIQTIAIISVLLFGVTYKRNIEKINSLNAHASTIKEKEFDGKNIYIETFTEYKEDTSEYDADRYSKIKIDIYTDDT